MSDTHVLRLFSSKKTAILPRKATHIFTSLRLYANHEPRSPRGGRSIKSLPPYQLPLHHYQFLCLTSPVLSSKLASHGRGSFAAWLPLRPWFVLASPLDGVWAYQTLKVHPRVPPLRGVCCSLSTSSPSTLCKTLSHSTGGSLKMTALPGPSLALSALWSISMSTRACF